MRIAIGSDHRGYEVKRRVHSLLERLGHVVIDMGPQGGDSVDYPDFAFQVATAVSTGEYSDGSRQSTSRPQWVTAARVAAASR